MFWKPQKPAITGHYYTYNAGPVFWVSRHYVTTLIENKSELYTAWRRPGDVTALLILICIHEP
jgi:hypothetical protein